jgi:hypothetical protein
MDSLRDFIREIKESERSSVYCCFKAKVEEAEVKRD